MTQQSRTPIGNRSRSITNSACWRFWIQPGQNSSQPCGTSTWKMARVLFWSSLSLHQPPLTNWQNCIDKSWESRTRVRWVDTILLLLFYRVPMTLFILFPFILQKLCLVRVAFFFPKFGGSCSSKWKNSTPIFFLLSFGVVVWSESEEAQCENV